MKVWIGFCLVWLMVRVASAQTMTMSVIPTEGSLGVFGYSKVQLALQPVSKIDPASIDEEALGEKVVGLLKSYPTFEAFLRGPVRAENLGVPRPILPLSPRERVVYNILAQKRLYPEVRTLSEVIEVFRDEIENQDYLLSLKERGEAQKKCFARSDYSFECTLTAGLEDKVSELVSLGLKGNTQHRGKEAISRALMNLILSKESPTVTSKEAFLSDSAHHWLNKRTVGDYLLLCIDHPKTFKTYELMGRTRCQEALGSLLEKEGVEEEAKRDVFSALFNPYGVFKLMLDSLSETVMKRNIYCFSDSDQVCRRRKIAKRIEDWPYQGELSSRQIDRLVKAIALYWD